MNIDYYKIDPTGNVTLIVETPVPRELHSGVASALMALDRDAEQVGFLEAAQDASCRLRLQMMGGEFCGNASISVAALTAELDKAHGHITQELRLEVSGAAAPLDVLIRARGDRLYAGRVAMPLPEDCFDFDFPLEDGICRLPVVRFPGICHAVVRSGLSIAQAQRHIAGWCALLGAEALGLMFLDGERLTPLVFVASTGSSVLERSCASGSSACASYLALQANLPLSAAFIQPGGTLSVDVGLEAGRVSSLHLTGSAQIVGKYSAEVSAAT